MVSQVAGPQPTEGRLPPAARRSEAPQRFGELRLTRPDKGVRAYVDR